MKTEEAQPSSLMHGAANALKTFQSVLAAGDTVMKTFPVADMVRAGQQMSSSGLLNLRNSAGVKGGVPLGVKDKATGATRLPKGGRWLLALIAHLCRNHCSFFCVLRFFR